MRKLLIGLTAVAALVAAGPGTAVAATTKTVTIVGSGFTPKTVTITEGDTVQWINRDSKNHQVLENRGRFVSPILGPNQRYTFTFNAAGTYNYKDELNSRLTGQVVVKGAPPTLTLAASTGILTYGDEAQLSGIVSSKKEGESVVIYYRPYPQANLIERATVLSGPGGAFSFLIKPQILTTYQAAWKGAFSLPVSVQVAPKISLGRNNGWLIHVSGGSSFAGRAVQLQRLNALTGQWVTLKKPLLNSRSSAKVVVKLPKGTNRLRVAMSVNQAGAGYLGAFSKVVLWRQAT
jgi:plastocyanin